MTHRFPLTRRLATLLLAATALGAAAPVGARAETIRVAVGTQDTTINCATGGLLIRELKLLEKFRNYPPLRGSDFADSLVRWAEANWNG